MSTGAVVLCRSWSRVRLASEVITNRLQRNIVPSSTAAAFVVFCVLYSFWLYRLPFGVGLWRTPGDFWATYLSSVALVHGQFSQVYSQSTGLVTFPGISYLLTPAALLTSALHLRLGQLANPYAPTAWLIAGPFEMRNSIASDFRGGPMRGTVESVDSGAGH